MEAIIIISGCLTSTVGVVKLYVAGELKFDDLSESLLYDDESEIAKYDVKVRNGSLLWKFTRNEVEIRVLS